MSIFDAFTGDAAKEAADQQRQFLDQTRTAGTADINQAYGTSLADLTKGYAGARGDIGAGYTDANNYYGSAAGAYAPLSALGSKYGAGTNLYLDALGVNGAGGNDRANAAFTPSGAYNFNLNQGLESINRAAAARNGGNFGGNVDRDAQKYGAGLASNEYGNWLNRLGGLVSPELSATAGAAGGQAGIYGQQAGLASSRGNALAGLDTGEGTTLAQLGTNAANARVGLSTNLAPGYAKTYSDAANAETEGSKNLWNFGLGVANLGGKAFGLGGFAPSSKQYRLVGE